MFLSDKGPINESMKMIVEQASRRFFAFNGSENPLPILISLFMQKTVEAPNYVAHNVSRLLTHRPPGKSHEFEIATGLDDRLVLLIEPIHEFIGTGRAGPISRAR